MVHPIGIHHWKLTVESTKVDDGDNGIHPETATPHGTTTVDAPHFEVKNLPYFGDCPVVHDDTKCP